jgi:membrane associated rhomboid family serine protease
MQNWMEWTGGAPVAGLLLAVILAVGAIGLFAFPALIVRSLFRPYWLVPRSEYATLVTSGFVHADLGHLAFNAFTFWAFAFKLERSIGSAAFAALYFIGLFASDAGTWLNHHRDAEYRTLGASGAIMAVLFASIVYFPSASIYIMPIPIPIPAPIFAVVYLGYTVIASRRGGGRINHDAHLAGAVAGIAFVAIADHDAFRLAVHQLFG